MKILVNLFTIICLTVFSSCAMKIVEVKSPNENISLKFKNDTTGLNIFFYFNNELITTINAARFLIDNDSLYQYEIAGFTESSVDDSWNPVYGERSKIIDRYNGITLSLINPDKNQLLDVECRVYDEGMALRYLFTPSDSSDMRIDQENTQFSFDDNYPAWASNRAQSEIIKLRINDIPNSCERPLVIQRNDSSYLALGEAQLVDFARMKFKSGVNNSIVTNLAGEVNLEQAGYKSPWRFIMIASSPGELLENNYFIQNLNEPNKIENTSWIKPGKVIREVTLTTQGGLACIDFAEKHNLQYVEFDAGWYGHEYDASSDASTVTVDPERSPGPLDLHKVVDYANEKDIGIIMYINRRAMEKQLDEVLPLYKEWGIKGLKYGFVNVGPQEWTSWLHDAVRKAAEHELMVDIHDEYRPTGYSRTYPNLMTQEGIRGDEESPSTEHTLITLFTRMIAGAGDNTNCYLAPRVQEKMGGRAAQMAKAVMLYSPWQFLYWYDRPESSPHKTGGAGAAQGLLSDVEDLSFYDALPTVWDDTKVLEGKIGEYGTIARRSGKTWYIGSLTAKQDRNLDIPLSFLEDNTGYKADIYYQDEKNLKINEVTKKSIQVDRNTVLKRSLIGNSGVAIIISKD